jgi:hypothetical protein
VGRIVGAFVGRVGADVGNLVGDNDGAIVGFHVGGGGEGGGVGGAGEGNAVGKAVISLVGFSEGANVGQPHGNLNSPPRQLLSHWKDKAKFAPLRMIPAIFPIFSGNIELP